jgi:vacuolar-type H+-ATPase subunit E/Vma4
MGDKQKRELTADNRQFTFAAQPKFSMDGAGDKRQRKFAGVAYSGDVVPGHWYWGNVVFDLTTMSVPDKLPALIDHSRSQRCGYVTASSISNEAGLTVSGNLLSNEYGTAVATESDEGFPWQMSIHIEPGSIEEVLQGSNTMVNGRSFAGPITVFKNSKIVEVSFTATGWDSNTSAAAMSRGGESSPSSQGESTMDLKQLQDRVAALEAENKSLQASKDDLNKQLTDANDKLTKFSNEARAGAVQQLFADIGREYKADDAEAKAFSAMPQEAFDATAKVMREQFKKPAGAPAAQAQTLFQHTATAGGAQATQTTQPAANPLLADAEKRATQFKRG